MEDSEILSQTEAKSLSAVFLEAIEGEDAGLAPLSPFMAHTAKMAGITDAALRDRHKRAEFVYWFFDTFQRARAPYRLPVPRELLAWLNAPSERAPSGASLSADGRELYLTRFMSHLRSRQRKPIRLAAGDGYLRFLTWFAFECIPERNLPCTLLPDDLLAVLNQPAFGESLPLSVGMLFRARMSHRERFGGLEAPSEEALIAMSFEAATDALRAGDPRLLPPFVTRFWLGRPRPGSDLTRYEYFAARAWCPELVFPAEWDGSGENAARTWFRSNYIGCFPGTDVFASPENIAVPRIPGDIEALQRHPTVVFSYRDLESISGLSRAGKIATDALRAISVPVIELGFGPTRTRVKEEFRDNERQFCEAESAIHLININPEFVPECLGCNLARVAEKDYIIGQFYWELSDISSLHECALSLVDELWVASEYLKQVYARRTGLPVIVMGQAVELPPPPAGAERSFFGLPEDSYLFLTSFDAASVIERKNPLAAVEAFLEAFPSGSEKVAFAIKTRNTLTPASRLDREHWRAVRRLARKDRRIIIFDHPLSDREMAALHDAADCYVSLHRSEGFGFGPADAMARGKPAIVTGYSGVCDFCTPQTAFIVDFKLIPVGAGAYPYMDRDRTYCWADPNVRTASQHMRALYAEPDRGVRIGAHARNFISQRYGIAALSDRYRTRLAELGVLGCLPDRT